jgi:hypothetical protein
MELRRACSDRRRSLSDVLSADIGSLDESCAWRILFETDESVFAQGVKEVPYEWRYRPFQLLTAQH